MTALNKMSFWKKVIAFGLAVLLLCVGGFGVYVATKLPAIFQMIEANGIVEIGHSVGEFAKSNSGNLPQNWSEYLKSGKDLHLSLNDLEKSYVIENPGTPEQYIKIVDPDLQDQQKLLDRILRIHIHIREDIP